MAPVRQLHLLQFAGIRANDRDRDARPGLRLALQPIDGRVATSVTVLADPADARARAVGASLVDDINEAAPHRARLSPLGAVPVRTKGSAGRDIGALRSRIEHVLLNEKNGRLTHLRSKRGGIDVAVSMESGTPEQWAVTADIAEEAGFAVRLVALDGDAAVLLEGPRARTSDDLESRASCPESLVRDYAQLPLDRVILLTGPTGTGKTSLARRLHDESLRARRPFVPVNCAALPSELVESELFGHAAGSFTGAQKEKPGLFEQADGGTLYLDEIGELPLSLQAKLLDVLDTKGLEGNHRWRVRRVGDTRGREIDARIMLATNRELPAEVAAGRFRGDLLARIEGHTLALPPLSTRRHRILLAYLEQLGAEGRSYGTVTFRLERRGLRHLRELAYDRRASWPDNYRDVTKSVQRLAFAVWTERGRPSVGDVFIAPELIEAECERLRARWKATPNGGDEWAATREALSASRFESLSWIERYQARFMVEARHAHPENQAAAWRWLEEQRYFPRAGPSANPSSEFARRWRALVEPTSK